MAALAWIIGWVALLMSRSMTLLEKTGKCPMVVVDASWDAGSVSSLGELIEKSAYPMFFIVAAQVVTASGVATTLGWNSWYLGVDRLYLVPFSLVLAFWSFGIVTLISKVLELAFWISRILPISKRAT
jgi:hypothetical protein